MGDNIVIFGASSGAVKVAQTLKNIGLDFEFFVDNDSNKHGEILEGKIIKNPKTLIETETDYMIVIASMYHGEIENQLIQMGVKKENIVLKEKYILDYINFHKHELIKQLPINLNNTRENIIIDLAEGISLGGIERWGTDLANALYERMKKVTIFTIEEDVDITLDIKCNIKHFDLSCERYIESIIELVNEIITQLPCAIIINRINQILFAAYIVKKYYSDKIKIISVIHSDFTRMYEQNQLVQNEIDAILCVSNDVRNNLITNYNIDSRKVFYKDSPIYYDDNFNKVYSFNDKPIIIGYGARLEKAQKRSDLLLPLIQSLEEKEVNFRLYIAGGGSLYNRIADYITQYSLEHKIKLFGIIPFNEMYDFWKKCDIFINLSEIEGIGLSMLEAMSVGVVPVVTDTAGAKSFIDNDINGYVNKLGDIDSIAECVGVLCKDRTKLIEFGKISREKIKSRCNINNYVEYLESLINN